MGAEILLRSENGKSETAAVQRSKEHSLTQIHCSDFHCKVKFILKLDGCPRQNRVVRKPIRSPGQLNSNLPSRNGLIIKDSSICLPLADSKAVCRRLRKHFLTLPPTHTRTLLKYGPIRQPMVHKETQDTCDDTNTKCEMFDSVTCSVTCSVCVINLF
jgi:hypothetical protein